jgi:hypothetical protein
MATLATKHIQRDIVFSQRVESSISAIDDMSVIDELDDFNEDYVATRRLSAYANCPRAHVPCTCMCAHLPTCMCANLPTCPPAYLQQRAPAL